MGQSGKIAEIVRMSNQGIRRFAVAWVSFLVAGCSMGESFGDYYDVSTTTDANGNFSLDFSSSRCVSWRLVTTRSDPMPVSCELGVKGVVMNIVIPVGR